MVSARTVAMGRFAEERGAYHPRVARYGVVGTAFSPVAESTIAILIIRKMRSAYGAPQFLLPWVISAIGF